MTDSVPLLLRDQRHSLLKASLPMGAAPAMRRNAPPPEEEAMVFEMSHEHCGYDCETSPPSAAAARHEVGLSPAALANVRSGALLRLLQGWCIPRLCCEQGISPAALHAAFYLHQGNPVVRAAAQALRALVFLPKAS